MKISKSLLQAATQANIITPNQAQELWNFLQEKQNSQSMTRIVNLLFYLGGFIAIISVTLILSPYILELGVWWFILIISIYIISSFTLCQYFIKQSMQIPAALCLLFIITLAPVLYSSLLYLFSYQESVLSFFTLFDEHNLSIEGLTFSLSLILFYTYRFPLLLIPLCLTTWLIFYNLATKIPIMNAFALSSLSFGILSFAGACTFKLTHTFLKHHSYFDCLYLFAALALYFSAINLLDTQHEWSWAGFILFNVLMLLVGVLLRYNLYLFLASLGILASLGHICYQLLQRLQLNWVVASLIMSTIGLLIIQLGIYIQKNQLRLIKKITQILPNSLQKIIQQSDESK